VLALLLERAQQVVTKQELLDRVWEGSAVGDEALTSCVQELRRALDDDAREPRYIETRHRRGYRLIVPVAAAAPALPDKPAIAVMPFENMSGDVEQEYFVDGLVEDIITALSRISAFFVVARTVIYLQRPRGRCARSGGNSVCGMCSKDRSASRRPASHYWAAHRYDNGQSHMGRPLRGCVGRRFRFAGSDHVERRGRHRTQGPTG
jgi:hypothetical protein